MDGSNGQGPLERFQFALPGRLEYRDAARAFLAFICERVAERHGLPGDLGHQVVSAFVEAFNNAVVHAYRNQEPGPVRVDLTVGASHLELAIGDEGASFSPERVPVPDLEALPEGGLGLFIIRNFMDDVSYAREGGRNVLTMRKSWARPHRGDSSSGRNVESESES